MNQIPPFISNSDDDMHCVTAVYRMLYKHFFDEDYTWEQIEDIAKAIPGKGTWTFVVDTALAKRGIKIINVEPVDYQKLYEQGPVYLKELYGQETADYYLNRSNIASVTGEIPEFLKHVTHLTRQSSTEEIIDLLKQGKLVGAEINSSILNKKEGFSLHFVLLYAVEGDAIIMHDPGLPPKPARRVPVEDFRAAFEHPGGSWTIHTYEK
jgi:hypothetical protein